MFGIDKIKVICLLNCLTLGLLSHVGDVNYYKTEGECIPIWRELLFIIFLGLFIQSVSIIQHDLNSEVFLTFLLNNPWCDLAVIPTSDMRHLILFPVQFIKIK